MSTQARRTARDRVAHQSFPLQSSRPRGCARASGCTVAFAYHCATNAPTRKPDATNSPHTWSVTGPKRDGVPGDEWDHSLIVTPLPRTSSLPLLEEGILLCSRTCRTKCVESASQGLREVSCAIEGLWESSLRKLLCVPHMTRVLCTCAAQTAYASQTLYH